MRKNNFNFIGIYGRSVYAQTNTEELSATIIALEKAALEKWNQGDPSGYLDLSAEDVTYFDPSLEQRMDGLKTEKLL
jgi:hypothetical protein